MNLEELKEQLARGIDALGLSLDKTRQLLLLEYLQLLVKWNKIHNLTAVRDPEQMVTHHLLDALAVIPHLSSSKRILDVGSGGGIPGLILAISRPDWEIHLIDSNHKKTAFLQQAAIELQLPNVTVHTGRIEALDIPPFDTVISRAFSELADFVKLAHKMLAADGAFQAMKGVYPFEEVAQLPAGFKVESITPLVVPELNAERHLVTIRKVAA
ncbi:16S rRNA (guanine(527)-N(7))-methyltransferase RsmG [Leeia sp. TBRC 13508]|uniref:Ribosomal RNA small subunit methyltransferase G n=1 Tax=Leeia speluncae TaxID=2884804 RepID=A0ABS8D4C6_9NEIS|nr:16S rRNA (guanine(527)-N(7))-methyltransferase RsmG [Leeia speluncae]MCB6182982.1 16S rRNA (guanine(527)-N(7))-methyltransferase RsmG [Leeia speluncae]